MKGPYVCELPAIAVSPNRHAIILARCAGKRVLHIGCVDSELVEDRYSEGILLHTQLAEVADEVWGIDIDKEGLGWLREKGFDNLFHGDAENLGLVAALIGQQFDVIVAAELLEHLSNPGLFLSGVKPYLSGELIITVPNAFRSDQTDYLRSFEELVHPEHVCWYSCATLARLLVRHSYHIKYAAMCGPISTCELSPYFAKGLVFVVREA